MNRPFSEALPGNDSRIPPPERILLYISPPSHPSCLFSTLPPSSPPLSPPPTAQHQPFLRKLQNKRILPRLRPSGIRGLCNMEWISQDFDIEGLVDDFNLGGEEFGMMAIGGDGGGYGEVEEFFGDVLGVGGCGGGGGGEVGAPGARGSAPSASAASTSTAAAATTAMGALWGKATDGTATLNPADQMMGLVSPGTVFDEK